MTFASSISIYVNINGVNKNVDCLNRSVNINGVWKNIGMCSFNINGVWHDEIIYIISGSTPNQ